MKSKVFMFLVVIVLGIPALFAGVVVGIIYEGFMAGMFWAEDVIDTVAKITEEEKEGAE